MSFKIVIWCNKLSPCEQSKQGSLLKSDTKKSPNYKLIHLVSVHCLQQTPNYLGSQPLSWAENLYGQKSMSQIFNVISRLSLPLINTLPLTIKAKRARKTQVQQLAVSDLQGLISWLSTIINPSKLAPIEGGL